MISMATLEDVLAIAHDKVAQEFYGSKYDVLTQEQKYDCDELSQEALGKPVGELTQGEMVLAEGEEFVRKIKDLQKKRWQEEKRRETRVRLAKEKAELEELRKTNPAAYKKTIGKFFDIQAQGSGGEDDEDEDQSGDEGGEGEEEGGEGEEEEAESKMEIIEEEPIQMPPEPVKKGRKVHPKKTASQTKSKKATTEEAPVKQPEATSTSRKRQTKEKKDKDEAEAQEPMKKKGKK